MDLPTLDGMNRAWAVHPPTHVSLAQDARQQQAEGTERKAAADAEFDSLYAQLPTMDRRL